MIPHARPPAAPLAPTPLGESHARKPRHRPEELSPLRAALLACLIISGGYLLTVPHGQPGWETITTSAGYAEAVKGYRSLSFSLLSGFDYRDGMSLASMPADVRTAQAAKVAIHGFMLPLDLVGDSVSRFLLNGNYDMCQFGAATGAPNQWVEVAMPAGRFVAYTHLPITVVGTFTVGEHRERGRVVSLYRLDADRVLTSTDIASRR